MASFGASDWMKKKSTIPLVYTRISDDQQSKEDKKQPDAKKKPALKQQKQRVDQGLKAAKLPPVKAENWFAEVRSGTDRDRAEWNKMMARAQALTTEGKRVFIAVQDPSRFARNTRHSMAMIDRLHDMGVPVFAVREGIQTGSVGDLHPTEELIFLQLQGGASFVSQEQKKKADQSVEIAKEAGIMSGKGQPLFPFARVDPLDAFYELLPIASVPVKEGGGKAEFKRAVAAMTAPDGVSTNGMVRLIAQENERREKLTDSQYNEWRAYRDKIRNLLIELNHDPFANNTDPRPINFKARALMRMVGRYLKEPWKYSPRPQEEIDEILLNFKDYLGTKDILRYKQIVGRR
jgi:DNA invertase Pin-like site-specific DNA recombinase